MPNINSLQQCIDLGISCAQAGRIHDAISHFQKALQIDPHNVEVLLNLGLLHLSHSPVQAELFFRKLLVAAPWNAIAHANLAYAMQLQVRNDEAEKSYHTALSLAPGAIEIKFNFATFLAKTCRSEDAQKLFIEIVDVVPSHWEAWNNLGKLLFEAGYISAAHTAFRAAVSYRPQESMLHLNIANVLLELDDLEAAEQEFEQAISISPGLIQAHQGLAAIHHRRGNEAEAARYRECGFGRSPIITMDYYGEGKPLQLLILASAIGGNIPWRTLIDQSRIQATIIAVEYFYQKDALPAHDLIFNAIGDADLCRNGLGIAAKLAEHSDASVINHPHSIMKTARLVNAMRMSEIPGVVAARMEQFRKNGDSVHFINDWANIQGISYPLLVRAPGYHGGNYFFRVEGESKLRDAMCQLPGDSVLVSEFIDCRSKDAMFKKYRVMSINGELYPIHLAQSSDWKVHYFSSDMAQNEQCRAEEAIFLKDFASYLGDGVLSILNEISRVMQLEYCGFDFGIDESGNVIVYEANATMTIGRASFDRMWDYKRPAIEDASKAIRGMFKIGNCL